MHKPRINVEMTPEAKAQLSDLLTRSECSTLTELTRKAFALYDLCLEHKAEGGKLVFRHADGTEETLRLI